MKKTKQEISDLVKEINSIKSDVGKIKFVIDHKDVFMFALDNDDTQILVISDWVNEDLEYEVDGLDWYIGNSDGVFNLLEAIGVEAEGV